MDFAASRPPAAARAPRGIMAGLGRAADAARSALVFFTPALDFGIRLLLASVFFKAGLTKIASWSTTLALFEYEYAVPLLPPEAAAWLGTAAELTLPVLLVLGLGTRLAAFALFVFNIVAVISYPDLGEVGLKDHQYWGLLLLVTLFHGPGKLSLDHLIHRRFG
ncbi:DoxX family protein [Aromatoleum anaerobium]|nr:DoxX family protein [Aromatoleum anaerobium]MCK0509442.1 DoxX family protein [Aromatoleum anaerobium]